MTGTRIEWNVMGLFGFQMPCFGVQFSYGNVAHKELSHKWHASAVSSVQADIIHRLIFPQRITECDSCNVNCNEVLGGFTIVLSYNASLHEIVSTK